MYKVLGADLHCPIFSLAFLKSQPSGLLTIPLLQFSFSNSFPCRNLPFNSFSPFSNLPPALSLQQFIFPSAFLFPSAILFPSKSPPTSKSQKPKSPKQKPQSKSPKVSSFSESFIPSGKQGGAAVLREGRDIVTGGTCVPASLNVNNLGEAAILHFPPLLWPGLCQFQPTDKHLRKNS
jgi:hypothetical protein